MKWRFPFKSLRTGLLLTYLALIATSVGLLGWRIGASLDASRFAETRRDQEGRAILTASAMGDWLFNYQNNKIDRTMLMAEIEGLSAQIHQRVALLDVDGTTLVDSEHQPNGADIDPSPQEIGIALSGHPTGAIHFDPDDNDDALFTIAPVIYQKQILGIVRLELHMRLVREASQQLWLRIIGVSLLAGLVTVVVSLWFANVLTKPISRLRQASVALAQGDLKQRVPVSGPEELRNLATSFNLMADRLARVMQDQRAFVANAAHEFRTPLTNIRLRAEALREGAKDDPAVADRFLMDIEDEIARLTRLVDELLDLSRLESGLVESRRAPVALQDIARAVIGEYAARAEKAGVALKFDAPHALPQVNADTDQVWRVFINLVDNAIKFTPHGGNVRVELTAAPNASFRQWLGPEHWVVASVCDTGIGIPVEDLPRIFDRFYRSDKARARATGGAGLGLAIVKSIVDAHAGKIWAESEPGKGTQIHVALPAA
ncbi:MAG: HAMP domain-containing protein [Chloroflexi bacterium]|nr:HAMP domain-containing protein [Chloroflexota bacterium]